MASQALDTTDKIVKFVVGPQEAEFTIRENVIKASSLWFKKALKEDHDGCIPLPHDLPDVVRLYFKFLNSQRFPWLWHLDLPWTKVYPGSSGELPEYGILANLYVFGERVEDVKFKNQIVDLLTKRMTESFIDFKLIDVGNKNDYYNDTTSWLKFLYPRSQVIDFIYRNTSAGSPARRLMADLWLWKAKESWVDGTAENHNTEFLMDVTRLLLRDRQLPSSSPTKTALQTKVYHENVDGTPLLPEGADDSKK